MKKLCLFLFLFSWSFVSAMSIPSSSQQQAPYNPQASVDPFEILNGMSDAELNAMMEELASLPPAKLAELEAQGRKMFEDAGYNLDELAQTFAPPAAPQQPAPKKAESVPTVAKQEKPKAAPIDDPSKHEKDSLGRMVRTIAESLASLRQKAASDETLHPYLAPLQQDLDLLTAYVNRFTYEKHLKYLGEAEFATLKTKLRKMSSMLQELDYALVVPELGIPSNKKTGGAPAGSYALQMRQATATVKEFKSYMEKAFSSETILTDIETLFKKYDKEALEIKKQIEEQQKKASEQVRKLSTTNTGKFAPIPTVNNQAAKKPAAGGMYGSPASPGYRSPSNNYGSQQGMNTPAGQQPQKPGATAGAKTPAAAGTKKPGEKDADGKTREKKAGDDADFAEVPLTPQEKLAKVQKDLKNANLEIAHNKEKFFKLVDDITAGKPSKEDRDLFAHAVKALITAKEDVKKYIADLAKTKELKETQVTHNKNVLKDFFKDQLPELKELNEKLKVITWPPKPFDEAMSDAEDLVKTFKKEYEAIEEQLIKKTRLL